MNKKTALRFVIFMGMVSLFGDIVYEGARSIAGPYLKMLGADAFKVGIIAGAGEFLGYAVRIISGYIADKTATYWPMTFLGYAMLISIPACGLVDTWQSVGSFLIMERVGKGIRTPARDTILSYATKEMGRGKGFGIHEALDQIGAIIGPLIFSAAFLLGYGYRGGFLLLFVPVGLCLLFLWLSKRKVPEPVLFEKKGKERAAPSIFWIYSLFVLFSVSGFCSFQLISFHIKQHSIASDLTIPLFYAAAMGIDAIVALFIGRIYDKKGLFCLLLIPFLSIPIPFFAFSYGVIPVFLGIILWGAVLGIHETIMRASVADIIGPKKRATAYGIFNTVYGLSFFLGSGVMGYLYERSISLLILFCTATQAFSFPIFILLKRHAE